MSEIVPYEEKFKTVRAMFSGQAVTSQLQLALPRGGVTGERLARIALTEIRRNPKLLDCSRESLLGAVMQCAQMGLEPGPMGLAYLIPYKQEATFQIGYKGLMNLVWRSEQISSVQAEVVREADHFIFSHGIPPELRHIPVTKDRGEVTHVYAVIGTTSGGWIFRVMSKEEIDAHRKRFSKKKQTGPWDTDWDEMACKTVLKRTAKRAPISTEAQQAIVLDDKAELGIRQEIDVTPPKAEDEPEPAPVHDHCGKEIGDDGTMCGLEKGHDGDCEPF